MKKLFALLFIFGCDVSTQENKPQVVEKIVYKDRPTVIEKDCPKPEVVEKIVEVEKEVEKIVEVEKSPACEERFITISDGNKNHRIKGCEHRIDLIADKNSLIEIIKALVLVP